MSKRPSSTYVRNRVLAHYAHAHPLIEGREVMYCGGGKSNRGCDMQITVGMTDWEAEHDLPFSLGGADVPPNTYPSCIKCHKLKTATVDAPMLAKVRAVKALHRGAKKTSRPMPHGKNSKTKRKLTGEVVPR
jgi:hypothetical protein